MIEKGLLINSYPMKLTTWTIRGLGEYKKRRLVRATILQSCSDIVVFQETKKEVLSNKLVKWTVGSDLSKWFVIPAIRSAGGSLCLESSECLC